MAIPLPGLDRLPAGPLRDFVEDLHELYDQAGQPAARFISAETFKLPNHLESVSHQTISATLQGTAVPGWPKVKSVAVVLAKKAELEFSEQEIDRRFRPLWVNARKVVQARGEMAEREPPSDPDVPAQEIRLDQSPSAIRAEDIVRPRIDPSTSGHLAPPVRRLPDRDPDFAGREALLERMRVALTDNPHTPLVLHGVGGVGKSHLAREYVVRHEPADQVTWWVPAADVEQASESMVELADRLGVRKGQSVEKTVEWVIGRLESQPESYLLVFDRVSDEGIRRLMPTFGGHVIVTTRDPSWAHDSTTVGIEVPDFSRDEAIAYVRKRDPAVTAEQAEEIVGRIGHLPLALAHAVDLHLTSELPWIDVLRRIEGSAPTSAQARPYPAEVAESVEQALQTFQASSPATMLLLELFAWFGSEPVSFEVLRRGHDRDVSPALARTLRNPVDLPKALQSIGQFGLARLHADQRIEVQAITRRALRDVLTPTALERARRNTHEILAASGGGPPDEAASMVGHREIAPHVVPADLIGSGSGAGLRTVYHQVRYRYVAGDYAGACSLAESAVTAWATDPALGPADDLVLRTVHQWANGLRALGEYRRARDLSAEGMERLRADPEYGHDHELTLSMASSHASDLRIAGDYQRALEIDQDTLARSVRRYGESDPRTARRRHNLAVSLRHVGDFVTAEGADRLTLEFHHDQFGPDDWRTMLSANALAEDLYGLGRYAEVLALRSEYAAARDMPGHLDRGALLFRRTLALARRSRGEIGEALDMLTNHYQDCARSFGDKHEYTLAAQVSLANTLRMHGEPGLALQHCRQAAVAYASTFGQGNPLTLAAEVNLCTILRANGERTGVRQLAEVASTALRDKLGERHPFTIVAIANLATAYAAQGQHAGNARALCEHAYSLAREVRGEDHPDTSAIAANLVLDRATVGDQAASAALRAHLATIRRRQPAVEPVFSEAAHSGRIECVIEPWSA